MRKSPHKWSLISKRLDKSDRKPGLNSVWIRLRHLQKNCVVLIQVLPISNTILEDILFWNPPPPHGHQKSSAQKCLSWTWFGNTRWSTSSRSSQHFRTYNSHRVEKCALPKFRHNENICWNNREWSLCPGQAGVNQLGGVFVNGRPLPDYVRWVRQLFFISFLGCS